MPPSRAGTEAPGRGEARTITAIGPDRKRSGWVVVEIDGRETYHLPVEALGDWSVGQALDAAAFERLEGDARMHDAVLRALRFLAPRPRSRQELTRRLRAQGVPDAALERALDRIAALDLLDDRAFAAWWVADRCAHRPRSILALRVELQERGVARADIDAAVAGLDDEALATDLALSRADRHAGHDRSAFDRRLGGFLARRGFAGADVRRALDRAWRAVHPD